MALAKIFNNRLRHMKYLVGKKGWGGGVKCPSQQTNQFDDTMGPGQKLKEKHERGGEILEVEEVLVSS